MFSRIAEIVTVFDVQILQKRIKYHLCNGFGFPNVIADVISGDKEVEEVINIEALGKPLIFPASLVEHVPWCL